MFDPSLPAWWSPVTQQFAQSGVPWQTWIPIVAAESFGRAGAALQNAQESSIGLLQINQSGGQGQGYSAAELRDPLRNVQIGAPYIARAYQQYGSNLARVAAASGHPGDVPASDPRIQRILSFGEQVAGASSPEEAWRQLGLPGLADTLQFGVSPLQFGVSPGGVRIGGATLGPGATVGAANSILGSTALGPLERSAQSIWARYHAHILLLGAALLLIVVGMFGLANNPQVQQAAQVAIMAAPK